MVLIAHLWPSTRAGGLVGVDIFFVVSGFLITSHLARELERDGTLSVTRFWARRVRRLLPAAFTVLAASLAASYILIPKVILERTLSEIAASALYLENWLLAGRAVDYLAAGSQPTLVQHFWSLSVEEQFYLLWPLLLLGSVAGFARLAPRLHRGRVIVALLAVVLVSSLAYSGWLSIMSPEAGYFSTVTRAWEFAAGGLLAMLLRSGLRDAHPTRSRATLLNWIGFAMVAASAVIVDASTPYPGFIALLPVGGTALLIYSGQEAKLMSPSGLMRTKVAEWAGDRSYAIYLWHWPLIVLYPLVIAPVLTFPAKVVLVAVVIALADLTKRFVEDPVRRSAGFIQLRRWTFASMATGMIILVAMPAISIAQIRESQDRLQLDTATVEATGVGCIGAAAMVPSNDCPEPFAVGALDPASASLDAYWDVGPAAVKYDVGPGDACPLKAGPSCEFGELRDPSFTIALVGDSHAAAMLTPILSFAERNNARVLLYSLAACSSFETAEQPLAKASGIVDSTLIEQCQEWALKTRQELVDRTDIDLVLYTNRSAGYVVPPEVVAASWEAIRKTGKVVAVISDIPAMPDVENVNAITAPECVERARDTYDPCSWTWEPSDNFMSEALELSAGTVADVDVTDLFCDVRCHVVIGGVITYSDTHHISRTYAQTLSYFLGERLRPIAAELTAP